MRPFRSQQWHPEDAAAFAACDCPFGPWLLSNEDEGDKLRPQYSSNADTQGSVHKTVTLGRVENI